MAKFLVQWPANGVHASEGKQNEHLIKSKSPDHRGPAAQLVKVNAERDEWSVGVVKDFALPHFTF